MKYQTILIILFFFSHEILAQDLTAKQSSGARLQYLGKTIPLSDIVPLAAFTNVKSTGKKIDVPNYLLPDETGFISDNAAQRKNGSGDSVSVLQNFNGVSNVNSSTVSDAEGDVGLNHYFQMINRSFAIYDKQGNKLYGPADNHTIYSDFSGPWDDMILSDPIVMYDHIADRWFVSNMAYDWGVDYYEMMAVSATSDPLGSWYCYALQFDNMPDYPKFGVWTDGYYLSVNEFVITELGDAYFDGPTVIAFNREDITSGDPDARYLEFHIEVSTPSNIQDIGSFQPSDLDGTIPPPGTPNYFICTKDDEWGYPEDRIWIWEFKSDWEDPSNASFTETDILIPTSFSSNYTNMDYIPQPGINTTLHSLCHFTMYRLQYRNFDDYQVLLFNHTVEVDGNDHAGVRWYELRKSGNSWNIFQQGTYAPDNDCRWMGGIAMDIDGNIGLGYSVSGISTYPSIRITGRNYIDTLGLMTFGESEIIAGNGNQQYNQRWGDYSMMGVDPADGLTFWYTQQYMPNTGYYNFSTQIASFQLHKNLNFSTDSLCFFNQQQCAEGETLVVRNSSQYDVTIIEFENEGYCGDARWYIDPWNIDLPQTLEKGDSIVCTIKIDLPMEKWSGPIVSDSLTVTTEYKKHGMNICVDEWLITGCTDDLGQTTDPVQIKVYPNPFDERIVIHYELKNETRVTLEILNQNQTTIKTLISNQIKSEGTSIIQWDGTDFNMSDVSPGVYFCRFTIDDKLFNRKIVKQ